MGFAPGKRKYGNWQAGYYARQHHG
jgi:hypothetical protein